jgi:WD40 repeat protein
VPLFGNRPEGVRVWNVATRNLVRSTKIPHCLTYAVAFSPDGKTLASGSQFGRICLWEPTGDSGPKPVCDLQGEEISLTSVSISLDGKTVASVREDGNIRLWEMQTGKPMHVLKKGGDAKCGRVCTVDFSPDGKLIVTGHKCGVITLWDRVTAREIREIKANDGLVGASFTPDGKTLLSVGADKLLCHWDAATGKKIRQEAYADPEGFPSPDRTMTASTSGGMSGTSLCDAATGKRLHFWENPKPIPALDPQSIAFSPDGTVLGAASFEWVRICDGVSGQELFLVKGKPRSYDFFQALAFSSDGRILALGCGPKVLMWESSTGKQIHEFEGHRGSTYFVAFTPDGKYLVSTGGDGTALVWDVASFTRPQPEQLSPQRLETLWTELRAESQPAYRALLALADDPKQTVPFLNKQLPAATVSKPVARLVGDLDSNQFAIREKSAAELQKLHFVAEPALRRARAKKPSLEMSRRLDQLLDKLATAPDTVRMRRAVKLLGWINTLEARKVLETLAAGEADSIQTREAKAALNRPIRRVLASGGR